MKPAWHGTKSVSSLASAILCTALLSPAQELRWPSDTPEHHGMSRAALDAWKDRLAALHTNALLVVREGQIVYEWYAPGHGPDRRQGTASLAKAIVGGSSLMVALQDRRLQIDDPAAKYIPAWRQDPQKSRITIRQLATHTSGIEDAEQDGIEHMQLPGWKGAFWKRTPDPFSIAIHQAPVIFPPGTSYAYSNPGMAALAYAVTASLQGAAQTDLRALLKTRLFDPLEIPESQWSIGYGQPYQVDGLTLFANWGGGAFTPRATARIGQLMLQQGEWKGKRLFDRLLVETMTAYAGMPVQRRTASNPGPGSGLCWWLNFDGVWPNIPRDAFAGAGAGQELLLVVPSLDLVVLRNGAALGARNRYWGDAVEFVFNPVVEMARSRAPYPPSPVIAGVSFAPESTIARKAIDSDNWPITWGDDDAQYTSYGDGRGFEPHSGPKLSMGIAKVLGTPGSFQGINIPSPSGERTGDGARGAKASGMLMVGGTLYLWARNTGNSQLAWSEDHGRTWQWGFRFDVSFGSPAFLNFGKNYAGARDRFVYVYSQDGDSAYQSSDALVLARVPATRIRDRQAYEFFTRVDSAGRPQWTKDIRARGAVFRFPGRCQRTDVVYHPLLKRYLLALGYNHKGGWGIFDAPEPWGPWTTAFHTDYWGLGGTHGYRLPAKWIGPDARSMTLIFSGVKLPHTTYDAFCVRPMTFELRAAGSGERGRR
ncbi:MAG TPA: serine hydrolase [Bryobacteraceae bacterium]|nr:serine hydrolase [Bryobacteraceae bacterium]